MNMDHLEEQYMEQLYKRMGCFPVILLCICLSFVGCKTIRESELIEIHDTVTVYRGDTLIQYVYKHINDTVREIIEKTIVINEKGDTTKETTVNNYYHNHYESDSVNIYKALLDSIKQSLNQNHEKEKVVEKKDWWEEWKWKLIALAVVIAMLAVICSPTIKRAKS